MVDSPQMRRLMLVIGLASGIQVVVLYVALSASISRPSPTPPTAGALPPELQQRLESLEAQQRTVMTRLDSLLTREENTGRQPAEGDDATPFPGYGQILQELRVLRGRVEQVAATLNQGADDLLQASRSNPELNVANLTAVCNRLTQDEEAESGYWMFTPLRDIVREFGRPPTITDGYWWYRFVAADGREGHVGFRIKDGVALGCSGGFSKAERR